MEQRISTNPLTQWTPSPVVDVQREVAESSSVTAPGAVTESWTAMRMAFAASGGLLTVGELADGNDPDSQARFAQIAKGISTREIIGFMWQSEPWVPMFQFETGLPVMPRRALQPLFKLLIPLYEPWEMANWFARPNQWLSGSRPVDECVAHLEAVLDVAHLEHFIATGQAAPQLPVASGHGDKG